MFSVEQSERYQRAAHAMQSGVAMDQQMGSDDASPKHLRVGVNSALVDSSSLALLLIAKGLVTQDEYCEAIVTGMENEVASYEKRLSDRAGITIKLA